jgi:WD40 repeat protein
VVIASDDQVQWIRPSGPLWTQPLPARPADLAVDGDIAAVALIDGSAQLLRLSDGQLLAKLSGHGERVAALLFDPQDAGILWTASWDGSLRRWHGSAWRDPAQKLVDAAQIRWGSQQEPR